MTSWILHTIIYWLFIFNYIHNFRYIISSNQFISRELKKAWHSAVNKLNKMNLMTDWRIDWCLTAHQQRKDNFCILRGKGIWLRWLKMANDIQCTIPYVTHLQCNTVHSKTLHLYKRNKYKGYLPYDLLAYYYYAIITTQPIRYNFAGCGCSLTSCPGRILSVTT